MREAYFDSVSAKPTDKLTLSEHATTEEGADDQDVETEGDALQALTAGSLMFYRSNMDDPNIAEDDAEPDSDVDDLEIKSSDLLLLGARSDEQVSNVGVYVYEELQDNIYPHHDVPLPVYPLCLAWLDFQPGSSSVGNFAAVGTFAPYIEIWDLDVVDYQYPHGKSI